MQRTAKPDHHRVKIRPWTLKGLVSEVRALAISSAKRLGIPIGEWMCRAIRNQAQVDQLVLLSSPSSNVEDTPVSVEIVRVAAALARLTDFLTSFRTEFMARIDRLQISEWVVTPSNGERVQRTARGGTEATPALIGQIAALTERVELLEAKITTLR